MIDYRVLVRAAMLAVVGLLSPLMVAGGVAVAQDTAAKATAANETNTALTGLPHSLRFVPQDASFYYAVLNNRLKWNAFANSEAVKNFLATPTGQRFKDELLQQMWQDLQNQEGEEMAPWLRDAVEFFSGSQGRAYLPLLTNLLSQELFVFGDGSIDDILTEIDEIATDVFQTLSTSPQATLPPPVPGSSTVPRIVAGARLTNDRDRQQVIELLTMLEAAFRNNVLELSQKEHEFLVRALRRETKGPDHDLWIIAYSPSDYPRDAASTSVQNDSSVDDPDEALAQQQRRREQAFKGTLRLTLGIQHGYFIFSAGPEQNSDAELIPADPLYKTEICRPLLAMRNKTFSGVGYQSSVFQQQMSWMNTYVRMLPLGTSLIQGLLQGANIEPTVAKPFMDDVKSDVEQLQDDLRDSFTPASERLTFGFLYDGGIAGYQYHRHHNPLALHPQTLDVLKHVGATPLLFHASANWGSGNLLQTWLNRVDLRAQQFAALTRSADQAAAGDGPTQTFLSSMFRITKDEMLPSLGNQSAFVVDLSVRSKDWHVALPPSQTELPIPAPAWVYQLRDSQQHRRAWRQYYETFAPVVAGLGALAGLPPGSELPPATESSIAGGKYLHLLDTSAFGVEQRFSPGLGLSDQWAVYGLFPSQASTLLRPSAPRLPPPLNDIERPLIAAGYLNFRQLANTITLWVDYSQPLLEPAWRQQQANSLTAAEPESESKLSPAETLDLGRFLLQALQSFESYSQATYAEDNSVVTQYVLRIPQLKLPPPVAAR